MTDETRGICELAKKPKLTTAERTQKKAESALRREQIQADIKRQMIALGMLTPAGRPPAAEAGK